MSTSSGRVYFDYQLALKKAEQIFEKVKSNPIQPSSYVRSYSAILTYCERSTWALDDFVCAAHMVYGWMPTALDLYPSEQGFERAVHLLNESRLRQLDGSEIIELSKVINNSVVGASKLLHFVSPQRYGIWDSRIYAFLTGKNKPAYQVVNSAPKYLTYLRVLEALKDDARFGGFHETVNQNIRTALGSAWTVKDAVGALRALELVMFISGRNSAPLSSPL